MAELLEGLSVRERALLGLFAHIKALEDEIEGLEVLRNATADIEVFPVLNMVDAGSSQDVLERADGVTTYALVVPIEGHIGARSEEELGPLISDFHARIVQAAGAAADAVPELEEVLDGSFDSDPVDDPDVDPQAFFEAELELRFTTLTGDPFTLA